MSTAVRRVLLLVVWSYAAMLTWVTVRIALDFRPGVDAHAYWRAARGPWDATMYAVPPGHVDAFNYSPAFAQVVWPLAQLPWPVFGLLWSLAAAAALGWMLWPLGARWAVPLVLCCAPEIVSGNIFWLMALVVVAGTRPGARPVGASAWAVVALTKVTPALGPLWHLLRREWRSLGWSVLATVAVVAVSVPLAPDLWRHWLDFLLRNERSDEPVGSPVLGPLVVRLPLALGLLVWGALTDRRWTLPAATALATPVAGPAALTLLAAVPRLRAPSAQPTTRQDQPGAQSTSTRPSVRAASVSDGVPSRVTTSSADRIADAPPSSPARKSR